MAPLSLATFALCLAAAAATAPDLTTTLTLTSTTSLTSTTETSLTFADVVPQGPCDQRIVEVSGLQVPGCGVADGRCDVDACADTFGSIIDACIGQDYSLFSSGVPVPFEPVSFATTFAGLKQLGNSDCPTVPVEAVLDHPNVTISCEDSIALMGASPFLLGCGDSDPNQTTCSQVCQDVLQAPLAACSPDDQVTNRLSDSDEPVSVKSVVLGISFVLSDACGSFYQPIVEQFVGTCDAQLFPILSMAQDTMQLPGCSATDGRCSAACAGTWNAIINACVGQDTSLLNTGGGGQAVPFEPILFVTTFVGLIAGSGDCATVPVDAVLSNPNLTITCEESVYLLSLGSVFLGCGEEPNATACSQLCQDVLAAPLGACDPTDMVPSSLGGEPDDLIPASQLVQGAQFAYSSECQTEFQQHLAEWLAPAPVTCDSKILSKFVEAQELGFLPGCDVIGEECNKACADTWTTVFDTCIGMEFSLGGPLAPFNPVEFAASIVGFGTLRGACARVPIELLLDHPNVTLSCEESFLVGSLYNFVGCVDLPNETQTACPKLCQDLLQGPLDACSPDDQVPRALGFPDQLIDASQQVLRIGAGYSDACREASQPQLDKWLPSDTVITCDTFLTINFEVTSCGEIGGSCNPACADMWASIYNACSGMTYTTFSGSDVPVPFQPAAFAHGFGGVLTDTACAGVPFEVLINHPNVTLGCEDSTSLMAVGGQMCGEPKDPSEATTCSRVCQDILQAPLAACSPTDQVFSGPKPVEALAEVLTHSASYSAACLATFQPQLEQWQATATETTTTIFGQSQTATQTTTTTKITSTATTTSLTSTTTATHTAIRARVITTGSSMSVADPVAFASDPAVHRSLTNSYASLAGVAPSQCEVTVSAVNQGQLRRLAQASNVQVDVSITLVSSSEEPDAADNVADNLNNLDQASLASQVQTDLTEAGVSATVAVDAVMAATVEAITLTVTTMTTTATATETTVTTVTATATSVTTATTSTTTVDLTVDPASVATELTSFASGCSVGQVVMAAFASAFLWSL
jgi:hypothetical protein